MSDIWFATPSANVELASGTFKAWQEAGYKTAALIDPGCPEPSNVDLLVRCDHYYGYGWANNLLSSKLTDVDWIVFGGDDGLPDPNHKPQDIARECTQHFNGTFGVMQPIGEEWLNRCIATFCGSPWIGKEFRRRANQGHGPYWEAYRHYYDDTELQNRAIAFNCFWQRSDLSHYHNHWTRRLIDRPKHLIDKAALEAMSRDLFLKRCVDGFPGSELIE